MIKSTPGEFRNLPDADNVCWSALPWAASGGYKELETLITEWHSINTIFDSSSIARKGKARDTSVDLETLFELDLDSGCAALQELLECGFDSASQLDAVLKLPDKLREALSLTSKVSGYLEELASAIDSALPDNLNPGCVTLEQLKQLNGLVIRLRSLDSRVLKFRTDSCLNRNLLSSFRLVLDRLHELQEKSTELSTIFRLDEVPQATELAILIEDIEDAGIMTRIFKPQYRKAKLKVCSFLVEGKPGFNRFHIVEQLRDLHGILEEIDEFVNEVRRKEGLPDELWDDIETDAALFEGFLDWHQWVLDNHAKVSGGLFPQTTVNDFGKWVMETPVNDLLHFKALDNVDFESKFSEISCTLDQVTALQKESDIESHLIHEPLVNGTPTEGILYRILEGVKKAEPLEHLPGIYNDWSLQQISERLQQFKEAGERTKKWCHAIEALDGGKFGTVVSIKPRDLPIFKSRVESTANWAAYLANLPATSIVRSAILNMTEANILQKLSERITQLESLLTEENKEGEKFFALAEVETQTWLEGKKTFSDLANRNQWALENAQMLFGYVRLLADRKNLKNSGIAKLAAIIETGRLTEEQVEETVRHALFDALGRDIIDETPDLQNFSGPHQEQSQSDFRELDKQLLALTRGKVAEKIAKRKPPPGNRGTRVGDYTEFELLKHEISKQRRHLPLRQLLKRAGKATQALKPCFMMGPRSVAQYLEPGGLNFDLLVIDEASQMKPPDAIGAAARTAQLVVVGDPKQLPPTSFFDRLGGGEEDDDAQFAIDTSESILDAVNSVFNSRRLRWHYRSRHEALIAFSNRNFYDNHLFVFPSPGSSNGNMGIQFHKVADGCFAEQINKTEALAVAKRAVELLCMDPDMSLGVATMSAKQRDYVEGLIESMAKENKIFNNALAKNSKNYEKLFVKNLETVQGDERSVMLISCTYGPVEVGGRVYQRFGPINSAMGWRRLNVLFTRSRERMEIFSSMSAGDILVDEGSGLGVRSLRRFLHYAENKELEVGEESERPPDSDFEVAVSKLLAEHGYECAAQVGVAGFWIDLAVRHPRQPGQFIMGIECDGATYHSGKSVRDRDRLRQEILESLGWRIRRIWSTDWFHNPRGALAGILQELKKTARN